MPPHQGVWLHDAQNLLPRPNQPGQQDEEDAISPGERWPFHLPLEDNELLAEKDVFRQKLGLASAKVGQRLQRKGGREGFRPLSQASRECIPAAIQELPERGHHTSHTKSFSIL